MFNCNFCHSPRTKVDMVQVYRMPIGGELAMRINIQCARCGNLSAYVYDQEFLTATLEAVAKFEKQEQNKSTPPRG